ncbi:MAG: S53 family peptidase [Thermoanaerobaculia bacterium]
MRRTSRPSGCSAWRPRRSRSRPWIRPRTIRPLPRRCAPRWRRWVWPRTRSIRRRRTRRPAAVRCPGRSRRLSTSSFTAALAPAAAIDVVFAPGDIQGKVHAFSRLLTKPDGPAVISCSWGGFESAYRDQDVTAMESLFAEAAARDVTLCFASGDRGDGSATYGGPSGRPEVFYPGSSPYVVGCGGTTLDPGGSKEEISWSEPMGKSLLASGGGLSSRFERPAWQGEELPQGGGRWVPDVAAKADLRGGYRIVVGGVEASMGGTSAASPLWGALVALCNQALAAAGHGPVGYLTPHLYPIPAGATRDITEGSNGSYAAGKGWDAVTGWGSPEGEALLEVLLGG